MTTPTDPQRPPAPTNGQHVATISYDRRFWEVYLEFSNDPTQASRYRGRLCFAPADSEGEEPARRTAAIIIEESYEEAVQRARAFGEHQLRGLLRSVLPDGE